MFCSFFIYCASLRLTHLIGAVSYTHLDVYRRQAIDYQITTLIDFNSPVLGTQHAGLKTIKDFKSEIAPCRTFCFLHELEMLLDNELVKGGDINLSLIHI